METRTTKLEKAMTFIKDKWKWFAAGTIAVVSLLIALFQKRETSSMLKNQKDTSEKIINAEREAKAKLDKVIEEIKVHEDKQVEKVKQKFKSEKKKLESIKEKEESEIDSVAKSISDLTGAEHVIVKDKKK